MCSDSGGGGGAVLRSEPGLFHHLDVPPIHTEGAAAAAGERRSAVSSTHLGQVRTERLSLWVGSWNMGDALPPGLAPAGAPDDCRQEAAGDRYALQCGAPDRPARPVVSPQETTCSSRPNARPGGGVAWTEECRPADGRAPTQDGLKIRLGGND
jgi:hypothetical protein